MIHIEDYVLGLWTFKVTLVLKKNTCFGHFVLLLSTAQRLDQ